MKVSRGADHIVRLQEPYTPTPKHKGVGRTVQEGLTADFHFRCAHMVRADTDRGFANLLTLVHDHLENSFRHAPLKFVMDLMRALDDVLPRDDILSVPLIRQQ
ncbi:hypothetical protein MESS4_330141 [Mesorhizobium sp. STM 4661]|nr:hypothetical protein MESS4_330141 [Mesorhizobium sp. STM 4661]